ncbi:ABC transporter ATP-binding protein [Ruania halotolerans]|uniref:ABC transporter ATP-binding protein n=1 Tax=Ruania halotolerans TaxID=2897773 RepID=UPI001E5E37A4|nr:ABC transporter ATP-binding protein [Ruania halotolerans]UFU04876.1 ABC transporter ATP-binding protein [Ruania halotolerans]
MTARLEVTGVTRQFAGGAGVHDIDLTVGAGEIHALVGLNGAGKSTLMRVLLRMLRPDAGQVRILGRAIAEVGPEIWREVGHLVDYPLAYGELSGRENVRLAARLHGIARADVATAVEEVVAELGLQRYASVHARRLSLGNRQRVGIAGALVHEPQVIVLDEPSNSLDPAGVILLRESLRRRAGEGAGILVSSHHLDEVARIADRITVLNAGRVIGSLDPGGVDLERAFFSLVHAADERRPVVEGDV